jgi:hypothetical protein
VLGDIPRYAWHVRGTPRKHLGICAEKVDEHCFLFGVELRANLDFFVGVIAGVEEDRLNCLGWLEVASMLLRVGRLLEETIQVGDEGLELDEGLGVLNTFHITLISVVVHGSDGDNSLGAWHLEFEVSVVGDGHELGVAWSSQHRVIGPSKPDYLESEGFLSEVGGSFEADGQINLPKGQATLAGCNPVKRCCTGSDLGPIDLQEP